LNVEAALNNFHKYKNESFMLSKMLFVSTHLANYPSATYKKI